RVKTLDGSRGGVRVSSGDETSHRREDICVAASAQLSAGSPYAVAASTLCGHARALWAGGGASRSEVCGGPSRRIRSPATVSRMRSIRWLLDGARPYGLGLSLLLPACTGGSAADAESDGTEEGGTPIEEPEPKVEWST